MTGDELLEAARKAANRAYAPYTKFRVGAAVLADGRLFSGCNIENASVGLTVCAERTAIFGAVSSGRRCLEAIAVSCIDVGADAPRGGRMPCGACRQVIAEFAEPSTPVHIDGVGTCTVADLLPQPFTLKYAG